MIDDLKAMAIFVETVQQRSFRGAAAHLGLSPSVVSYHISTLEQRAGCALLYRSTRKISLTHEGEVLFDHAKRMIEEATAGLMRVGKRQDHPVGRLKIALPAVLIRSTLSREIAAFSQRYPDLELTISAADERQNIIQEGIDLAFRIGDMESSGLKSRKLYVVHRRLVCARQYLESHSLPKCPSELEQMRWIALAMLPGERTLSHRREGRSYRVVYQKQVVVNSVELMTALCIQGAGIATPPDFLVARELEEGKLVELLPDWQVDPIPVYAVWPDNSSTFSNAMHFLRYLSRSLSVNSSPWQP